MLHRSSWLKKVYIIKIRPVLTNLQKNIFSWYWHLYWYQFVRPVCWFQNFMKGCCVTCLSRYIGTNMPKNAKIAIIIFCPFLTLFLNSFNFSSTVARKTYKLKFLDLFGFFWHSCWPLGCTTSYSGGKNKLNTILYKIGKLAVALWKPWTEKWFIPHLKALIVSFNLKYQILQKP